MAQEIVRIFVNHPSLVAKQEFLVESQSHYLVNVMRLKEDNKIVIFNGIDGDWLAQITQIKKGKIFLCIKEKIKEQDVVTQKISLAFSLPKRQVLSDIAKQSTELGVSKFYPIVSKRSAIGNFNKNSFFANVIEACEQCKRNDIPVICDKKSFTNFIENINKTQNLIICDESRKGEKPFKILQHLDSQKENIIFVGPEGGFSVEEFQLMSKKNLIRVSLGNNILRVSTACIAAIALIKHTVLS
jgi:16S rRNA (uracil1498-N3)-methyltransferase